MAESSKQIRDVNNVPSPPVSLIICSRNRPHLLLDTVVSILHGGQVPSEIVVIDQSTLSHPTLTTMTMYSGCAVRYIWSQETGLSRARNQGIAAAQHPVLVFTDDDVLVAPTWFGTLVQALGHHGLCSVVTGRVLPAPAEQAGGFVPSTITDTTPAVYQGRIGRDVLHPLNMALFRSTITEVGVFDERLGAGSRFPAAEDNDFGFRLLEQGYLIAYVPEAVLYHRAWRSQREYLALRWSYARGQGAYYAKYLSLYDRYMLRRMLRNLADHALAAFWQVRQNPHQARAHAVWVLGLVSGAAEWLLIQRRTTEQA